MKTRLWVIGIVLIGCAAATACVTYQYPLGPTAPMPSAPPMNEPIANAPVVPVIAPQPVGSDEPFYDDLAPYGRWVYVDGPGWVWSPNSVQVGWRPYQLGHWMSTDYGWTWDSDEEWGSVVYHYGRWHQDPSYGWVWVPGTEWGPAWVAWHEGGGYVGWAPLPWKARVQVGVGLDWGGVNVSIQPSWWCFVNARNLVDPGLRNHIEPMGRNLALIQVTRNVTNYTFVNNRVVNEGVKLDAISRAVGHTIPRYRLTETDSRDMTRGAKVRGQDLVVFRPDLARGRKWQGRGVPPGHDDGRRPGDFRSGDSRQGAEQPAPPPGTPSGPATSTQPPANQVPPGQPPASQPSERDAKHEHGRKFFDQMMGRNQPGRGQPPPAPGHPAAPGQPPAPGQPAAPGQAATPATPVHPGAPGHPATPASPATPAQPGAPGQHGATTPPANPAPEKGQSDKGRGRGPKGDAGKPGKPKPNAPKADGSDADKSKTEKPDSNH